MADKAKPSKSSVDFFAIVENARVDGRKTVRERVPAAVPLDNKIATALATRFKEMADQFFSESTIIDFDGRYTPGPGELFKIDGFALDTALQKAVNDPLGTAELNLSHSPFPRIKALIAAEVNSPLRIIFQEFKSDQIIRQGWALVHKVLHGKSTYDTVERTGLAIGSDIDAVYDDGTLYFRSYYTANRFADLTVHFKDATNEEIKELLKMPGLVAEDEAKLLAHTDAAMRRKFAIIQKTGILAVVTPEQIRTAALNQGIDIFIDRTDGQQRIVIPSEKADAKDVLDFLCQARFVGSLTNEPFVANSFRPAKPKGPVSAQGVMTTPAPEEAAAVKKVTKKVVKKTAKKATKKKSS